MEIITVRKAKDLGMTTVLILGAGSDVALALAQTYAQKGSNLILGARNAKKLEPFRQNLNIRHSVEAEVTEFDALDYQSHEDFYRQLPVEPDIAVIVFGYLGEQVLAQSDWEECKKIIDTNYTGAVSIVNVIANSFEKRRQGTIVGISSVAGERGRMSNYIYGSAKAAFSTYLDGLRNRLFSKGVHVMSVKPGFMKTAMTEGMELPNMLTTDPMQAATQIHTGVKRKKNTIYISPVWRLIMFVIRNLPGVVFNRLKL